jgi:sulfur carrier protein
MQLYVNGDPRDLPSGATVATLVETLALGGGRIAVEVNEELVPRSTYAERVLLEGDRVEIVHAIGGG